MPTVPEEAPTTLQAEPPRPMTSAARASHSRAASFSANRDLKQALRRPSISSAELLRSSGAARSPNPLSPGDMAPDIYRKQAETISMLTEANEKLEAEVKALREHGERLGVELVKKEEIVEEMEELKGAMEGLRRKTVEMEKEKEEKGAELEKLSSELESAKRQVNLLNSQISSKDKTISELRSTASPNKPPAEDTADLLKSKEDLIEFMEMEISKLRLDIDKSSKILSDLQARITTLETQLAESETNTASLITQAEELKVEFERVIERHVTEGAARESAEAKVREKDAQVEKLETTVKKLEAQVAGWEKDHSSLKHIYMETDILSQTAQRKYISLEIENTELKKQIQDLRDRSTEFRRGTGSMQADDDILDTLEDDERQKLKRQVRELETLLEESKEPKKGHRRMMSEKAGFQEVQFLGKFPSIEDDEDFLPSTDDEGRTGKEAQKAEWRRRNLSLFP
ncbi:hypothetical protein BGX38DRAFT_1255331 [Terfezia claveryi]|nr:hypothetical protein BGX38DRAFT_1255331 [Terfezia claveryi]